MAAQDGAEAIFTAIDDGDVEEVKRLLDQDSGLLEAHGDEENWNRTPLIWAAQAGRREVVRLLLDLGAGVNARDAGGDTALHLAALCGDEEVVAFLLSGGADANAKDNREFTALHYGSCHGHLGMVRLLLQHLRGRGLDDQNDERCTALWYASANGHTEVARALLLAGADHTITGLTYGDADDATADDREMTPLQVAQEDADEDTVTLFKWWESELERGYVVHRARYHLENHSKLQQYCAAHAELATTLPHVSAYLRPRTCPLEVEIVALADSGEEEQKGEGSGKRKTAEQGGGEGPCEGEKQATLQYVMDDLAPELYIELMAGFH